jgi:hypothetical protein
MDRRELLKMIAVLTGTAFIGGETLLSGCKSPDASAAFSWSESDLSFLNEVGETILPATSTPGAKAANVSQVMKAIVTDCYDEKDRAVFFTSRKKLDEAAEKYGTTFEKASAAQREELLTRIDKEAKEYQKNKKPEETDHYFTMLKQLTLLGYFTSEIGSTQAMRYIPVPQRYDGCIPYKKGDKIIV